MRQFTMAFYFYVDIIRGGKWKLRTSFSLVSISTVWCSETFSAVECVSTSCVRLQNVLLPQKMKTTEKCLHETNSNHPTLGKFSLSMENALCKHTPRAASVTIMRTCLYDDCKTNSSLVVHSGHMVSDNAMHEQFSMKSDVFSFGVLAIEIVSGRKRGDFRQSEQAPDLLHYVRNSILNFNFLKQVISIRLIIRRVTHCYIFLLWNCVDMEAMDRRKSSRADGSNFS